MFMTRASERYDNNLENVVIGNDKELWEMLGEQ